jgi:hypothetical protein
MATSNITLNIETHFVEATNTNFVVVGFTRSGLKPTIYHTRGEHANHYTTDAVNISIKTPKLHKI